MIFIGSSIGGRLQDKQGPRRVAILGGVIYGFGVILASFSHSHDQLWLGSPTNADSSPDSSGT